MATEGVIQPVTHSRVSVGWVHLSSKFDGVVVASGGVFVIDGVVVHDGVMDKSCECDMGCSGV